jgi:hypothetical protein
MLSVLDGVRKADEYARGEDVCSRRIISSA